jgi:hypothetical protein
MKKLMTGLALLVAVSLALAGDSYVAPWGSDSGDGSAQRPWQSLRHAVEQAQSGDAIYLRGGVYAFQASQRFYLPHGLSNVAIVAYEGEEPIIRYGDGNDTLDYFITFQDNSDITLAGLTVENIQRPICIFNGPGQAGAHHVSLYGLTLRNCGAPGTRTGGRGVQISEYGAVADLPPHDITIDGLTVEGCSEVGIKVLGRISNVVIRNVSIRDVNDGCGVDGDGDGMTFLPKYGNPDGITLENVTVENCSEDGLDLTADRLSMRNVAVRDCGACDMKLWAPAVHGGAGQGQYRLAGVRASAAGECGLKAHGGPLLFIEGSDLAGLEWGLRYNVDAMPWPGNITASYCRFSSAQIDAAVPVSLANCIIGSGSLPVDLRADFSGDGRVDGLDFLRWQAGYGEAGGHAQGDADGDGQVDGADFLIWQAAYAPNR